MANICDYLEWRGDLSFEERPFNEVDALILSCLSYLDLASCLDSESTSIKTACQRFLERFAHEPISNHVMSLATLGDDFVAPLMSSTRFGECKLRNFVDKKNESRSLQFAAVTIDLPCGDSFVSFRGTDLSLVGWREDFMLSFAISDAQRMAHSYLKQELKRCAAKSSQFVGGFSQNKQGSLRNLFSKTDFTARRGPSVYVGGHSKGAALATYASTLQNKKYLSLIQAVFSFDGPGMTQELSQVSPTQVLDKRYVRIQPAYSVVGQLFDVPEEPRTYVVSSGDGIMQHDPVTWQVLKDSFVQADGLDAEAKLVVDVIDQWLKGLSLDNRRVLTEELFEILAAGGATSFSELTTTPQGLQKILSAAASASDTTKAAVRALIEATLTRSMLATREKVEAAFAQAFTKKNK